MLRDASWLWSVPAALRRLVRTRSPRDALRMLDHAARRLRHDGPRALGRQILEAPNAERQDEAFRRWCERHTPDRRRLAAMADEIGALRARPRFSVVTPVYNTEPALLRACIESVRAQIYPDWELCLCDDASTRADTTAVVREAAADPRVRVRVLEANRGIAEASNEALSLATGDFVVLLDHDDEITPDALFEIARWLGDHPDADMLYSDEDKLDARGRCDPYFKPDWSPEHFLSTMYTCHLMAVRRTRLDEIGGFRAGYDGAQDYDLVLRLMERTARIHHIPKILYHWRKVAGSAASENAAKPWAIDAGRMALADYVRRRGWRADVLPGVAPGVFRIRREIAGRPLVSIVIPTRGRDPRLARCLTRLADGTAWRPFEVLVVADQALGERARAALARLDGRIVPYDADGGFNFSRKVNAGARAASGGHLLLLNDDVEPLDDPDWLSAMLEYSQAPDVGAVGAKLVYPDGRVQHAGIVLGVRGVAAHAFHQHPPSTQGHASSIVRPGNFSAVSAACLMTRRDVFDEAGGFDECFPVDFNDVDYCLKVRRAGRRVVFTPYAQLVHDESASVGRRMPDPRAIAEMRRRWGPVIDRDPYYHPDLSREYPDYRIRG